MKNYSVFFVGLSAIFSVMSFCAEEREFISSSKVLCEIKCDLQQRQQNQADCSDKEEAKKLLALFPSYKDIKYPDNSENDYVQSLFRTNNAIFEKILMAISTIQSERCVSFLDLVLSLDLQKEIAQKANIEFHFVRLYLSRAIAWHVNSNHTTRIALAMIEHCISFWDINAMNLLLSLFSIEDYVTVYLFGMQSYLTKLAFYKQKYTDYFCFKNEFDVAVYRKVLYEHLPYSIAFGRSRLHSDWYQTIVKLLQEKKFVTDDKELKDLKARAHALSQEQEPFLVKLGNHALHRIVEEFVLDTCNVLGDISRLLSSVLADESHWFVPKESRMAWLQIQRLIADCNANRKDRFNKHCASTLTMLYLDYNGLSIASKLCDLLYAAEQIVSVFSEPIPAVEYDAKNLDSFFKGLKRNQIHNEHVRQLVSPLSVCLREYEEKYLPLDVPFRCILPVPVLGHDMFASTRNIFLQQRLFESIFSISENCPESKSDHAIVDELMRVYFADEYLTRKIKSCDKSKIKRSHKLKQDSEGERPQEENVIPEPDSALANVNSPYQAAIALRYHGRILGWFKRNIAKKFHKDSVLYHTYAPTADWFILREGLQNFWQNDLRYKQYSLPGKMIKDDGSTAYVTCSCTCTPDEKIYHRGYDLSDEKTIKERFGITVPAELPVELVDQKPFAIIQHQLLSKNKSLIKEETDQQIVIYDPINKLHLILFRLHMPHP